MSHKKSPAEAGLQGGCAVVSGLLSDRDKQEQGAGALDAAALFWLYFWPR